MRKIFYALLIGEVFFAACSGPTEKSISEDGMETVVIGEFSDGLFTNPGFVESIEIIPIRSGDVPLPMPEQFNMFGGDYYLVKTFGDVNIARIGPDGNFLNNIGRQGRGPNEFVLMSDYNISPEGITIYSSFDSKAYRYSADGTFADAVDIPVPFDKVHPVEGGYWVYAGQGREKVPYPRLMFCDNEGNVKTELLDGLAAVPMTEDTPVFIPGTGELYVRETFNNDIYVLDGNEIRVAYRFDFGEYNIPKAFYEVEDMISGAEMLMANDYAIIRRFFDSKDRVLAHIDVQLPDTGSFYSVYGTKNKAGGKWSWVKYDADDIFANSIMFMDGDSNLWGVVEPARLGESGILECSLVVNRDAASGLGDYDNPVIIKISLRK